MSEKPAFLGNSIIIAAHPDDEMLWFGAILEHVDEVLLVFEDYWPDPAIGPARAEALARYPHANISSLKLPEAATYGCSDWQNPVLTQYGIELGNVTQLRDAKQSLKRLIGKSQAPKTGIRASYENNFKHLVSELRTRLTPQMNVFTHNPWGEYGHEDHIQVFRALDLLRSEIGFKLWMSNYCSERSLPLATTYFDQNEHEVLYLPVNKELCDEVAQVYRDTGCWTWTDEWNWFDFEIYLQAPAAQINLTSQGSLCPLNMFNIEGK